MTTRLDNLKKIFNSINISINSAIELENIEISRDILLTDKINNEYNNLIEECKIIYNSSKLTALHNNRLKKQKYPSINFLRQILKCNGYNLTPKIVSLGYYKCTGKKIVKRSYIIKKI